MKNIINLPDKSESYTPHEKVQKYFEILEPIFPVWLYDYINTREMLHQKHISMTCGTLYTDLFESDFFYSSLDHSIGVALIVWHFTHDKKQTLAGLFHDIATPVFKHCVDYMNGDYLTQESTEELTHDIITNSPEITNLLSRDSIKINEVDDYHIYPIADNDTPKLSADRLEYSLSNAYLTYKLANLNEIKKIYQDIVVGRNEIGEPELEFKTKNIARDFVKFTSKMSIIYRDDRTRYTMQFLADTLKKLNELNLIQKEDLYNLTEKEVINIIDNSNYARSFNKWRDAKKIETSPEPPEEKVYSIHQSSKIRYIDPLCENNRMSKTCELSKQMIEENLSYDMSSYVYLPDLNL